MIITHTSLDVEYFLSDMCDLEQGSNYGLVTSVLGTKGDSDPNWYVGGGEVFHKLFAGSNLLMGE
jgi:hypothetical protein